MLYKTDNQTFKLSSIYIDNDFQSEYDTKHHNTADLLYTKNNGYSFNWNYLANSKSEFNTGGSASIYHLNYENRTKEEEFEKDEENDNNEFSIFLKKNYINDYLFFSEFSYVPHKNSKFLIGYQFNKKQVSYIFKELMDILYILDTDDSEMDTHSVYASFHHSKSSHFSFDLGLRGNYYSSINHFRLEPR